jgi:hypothetical protein
MAIVRAALGYATQVWSPQSIKLVKKTERVQRRASNFILRTLATKIFIASSERA